MANRRIPLRNPQAASRKDARRKNGKANGAGKAPRDGQQFHERGS
jgi:hypothetical protein